LPFIFGLFSDISSSFETVEREFRVKNLFSFFYRAEEGTFSHTKQKLQKIDGYKNTNYKCQPSQIEILG